MGQRTGNGKDDELRLKHLPSGKIKRLRIEMEDLVQSRASLGQRVGTD